MKAKKPKKAFVDYTEAEVDKYREAFMKNTIRRSTYRWPWKNIAAQLARVERGLYKCAKCKRIVRNKDKKADHIDPIVNPLVGFVNWDVYFKRALSPLSNWQILCTECHDAKTAVEREVRKATKKGKR